MSDSQTENGSLGSRFFRCCVTLWLDHAVMRHCRLREWHRTQTRHQYIPVGSTAASLPPTVCLSLPLPCQLLVTTNHWRWCWP